MADQTIRADNHSRRLLHILWLFATLVTPLATAQETAKRYFDLNELGDIPGVIQVSTDYLTIIEFEGYKVEEASTARSDLYVLEISDNVIRIRANKEVVNTDLYARVAGRTVLFKLESDPTTETPRRYVVRNPPQAKRGQQAYSGASGAIRPANSSAEDAPLFPLGLLFEADIFRPRQSEIIIQYRLINESKNPIVNDAFRLRVYYGDTSIKYTRTSSPVAGRPNFLAPGEAEYGQIVIPQAPANLDDLELEWVLIEVGPGTQHKLIRNLGELADGAAPTSLSTQARPTEPGVTEAETGNTSFVEEEASQAAVASQEQKEVEASAQATEADASMEGADMSAVAEASEQAPERIEKDAVKTAEDASIRLNEGATLVSSNFENGVEERWVFYKHESAEASLKAERGEVCITTVQPGQGYGVGMVSLLHLDLSLEQGKTYTINFDAYADKPIVMLTHITLQKTPFTTYYQNYATLESSKRNYSYTFEMPMNEPEARLGFLMGGESNAQLGLPYRVCIDNISLASVDGMQAAVTNPEVPEQQTENEREEADLGETFKLVNSSFESGIEKAWRLYVHKSAEAIRKAENSEACVTVSQTGGELYRVGFHQTDLSLKQGKTYALNFDAYADKPVSIGVQVRLQENPFTQYHNQAETLELEKRSYSYSFEMPKDEPKGQLVFHLGGKANAKLGPPYRVCFDNISLIANGANLASNTSPDPSKSAALLVVDIDKASQIDEKIKKRLEALGYSVSVQNGVTVSAADAAENALVIISSSLMHNDVSTTFRDVPVPVITFEEYLFPSMGMTGPEERTDFHNVENQGLIRLVAPGHPLSAGLSGDVSVSANPAEIAWGKPAADAVIVASLLDNPNRAAIFAYEAGAQMVDMVAPARRVGLFYDYEDVNYKDEAWAFFDAAVQWAAGHERVTEDATPRSTSASATNTNILINETFKDSSYEPWFFWKHDSAQASSRVEQESICFSVDKSGEDMGHVSFGHNELMLEPGQSYTLSFDATADKEVSLFSAVSTQDKPINHLRQFATLTPSKRSYSYSFTPGNKEPSQLAFRLGGKDNGALAPYRVCLDNVKLSLGINPETEAMNEKLLSNDFENGAETAWFFNKQEAVQATSAVKDGEFCVTVEHGGKERWKPSLVHRNLALKQGESYTLSFDAYADKAVGIYSEVGLQHRPHFSYHRKNATLSTAKDRYAYTFHMSENLPKGRVVFALGGAENAQFLPYTVCLDNVRIARERNEVAQDASATSEEQAQAKGVEISNDVAMTTLVESRFYEAEDRWRLGVAEAAQASSEVKNGQYCITIGKTGVNHWDIALRTPNLNLRKGYRYTLDWKGISERPVILRTKVGESSEPWDTYGSWETTLGSSEVTHTHTFTMDKTDPDAMIEFHMGADYTAGNLPTRVCLDDIQLVEVGLSDPPSASLVEKDLFTSTLVAQHSQLCLTVPESAHDEGKQLVQWNCTDSREQQFEFRLVNEASSTYLIANPESDKCLSVADSSSDNGTPIHQADCSGAENQQFELQRLENGSFQLVAQHSGKCLDIAGVSKDLGAVLHQWRCHGLDEAKKQGNQIFLVSGKS